MGQAGAGVARCELLPTSSRMEAITDAAMNSWPAGIARPGRSVAADTAAGGAGAGRVGQVRPVGGGHIAAATVLEPHHVVGDLWAALALLATTTKAVHHRCITGPAFGGTPRNRWP